MRTGTLPQIVLRIEDGFYRRIRKGKIMFPLHQSRSARQFYPRTHHVLALTLTVGLVGTTYLSAQDSVGATPKQLALAEVSLASADVPSLPEAPGVSSSEDSSGVMSAAMVDAAGAPSMSVSGSFPTFRQREQRFFSDLVGPSAFLAPAFQAGIDTGRPLKVGYPSDGLIAPRLHPAHGDVPEWGEGAQGYAKRYADRFGQGLISTTSRYALGEALRQDVSYHRCQCGGLLQRTGHAVVGAYLAQTRDGRTVPSLPALVSPFVSSEVAVSAWYPGRYNTSDALRISVVNYIAAPFKNLFTEFFGK